MTQRKVLEAMLAYAKANKSAAQCKEVDRRIKEFDLDNGVKCIYTDEELPKKDA